MPEARETVVRFVGVYDADGSVRGELGYFVAARLGRAHCALCDITHGLVRERRAWRACRDGLPVPFETFHRDDQPDAVRSAVGGLTPVVVADTGSRIVPLLGSAELDACAGSVEALVTAVARAAADAGLVLPAA